MNAITPSIISELSIYARKFEDKAKEEFDSDDEALFNSIDDDEIQFLSNPFEVTSDRPQLSEVASVGQKIIKQSNEESGSDDPSPLVKKEVTLIGSQTINTNDGELSSGGANLASQEKVASVEQQTIKTNAIAVPVINEIGQKNNGDVILTTFSETVYCGVDGGGVIRNLNTTAESIAKLLHASSTVSGACGAAVPLTLLLTGAACAATGIAWTLPHAISVLKDVNKELASAETEEAEIEAKIAAEIAKLGVANQSFYIAMGGAQMASGTVAMCCPETAHVFHYAPLLTGHAATTATLATGVALGAIYVVRGGVMLTRAVKSYRQVSEFHNEFKECKTVDDAIKFMEKAEGSTAYMNRRVEPSCLEGKDKEGNAIRYTASGKIDSKGSVTPYSTDKERLEYLGKVDKGIFTEELKHKVAMVIAISMIVGGILAIIGATVLTGGVGAIAIALASAVFFMSMEYVFLNYDSSKAFEWLRDHLYKEAEWLQAIASSSSPELVTV